MKSRHRSADEKLSILSEAKKEGITATIRKHGIYSGTFYQWKEKHAAGGKEALSSKHYKVAPEGKRLQKENQQLKQLLAEKELARLLNSRIRRDRRGKRTARDLLQNPRRPFECMQTDIKYIYIHSQHRNALLITVLDVFSRGVLGYRLEWSITRHQVIDLMRDVLYHYSMPEKVSLRRDNGSQFEAGLFREYLREMRIDHEFTHVASPQENCYIESYYSIVESAVCAKYELESLEEAKEVLNRFINFYNQGRVHGSLGMLSPSQYLQERQAAQCLRLIPLEEDNTVIEN